MTHYVLRSALLGAAVLIAASLTACVGSKVVIAPDPTIDPATDRTFAWEENAIQPSGRGDGFYHIDLYLRRQVNSELETRGYRQVAREDADFLVAYRLFQSVDVDQGGIISPSDELMSGLDRGLDPNRTEIYHHDVPEQIRRGNLELILFNPRNKRVLWRASWSRILKTSADDSAAVKKVMEHQVPKLFEGFPSRH